MPSNKVLLEKQKVVEELKAKIDGSVAGVLVDYKGINVADDTKLRKEMREAGVHYSVYKNSAVRFAVTGGKFEELAKHLDGTTAVLCLRPTLPLLPVSLRSMRRTTRIASTLRVVSLRTMSSMQLALMRSHPSLPEKSCCPSWLAA